MPGRKKTPAEVDWDNSEIAKAMGNMCGMRGPHPYPWPELLVKLPWYKNPAVTTWSLYIISVVLGLFIGILLFWRW